MKGLLSWVRDNLKLERFEIGGQLVAYHGEKNFKIAPRFFRMTADAKKAATPVELYFHERTAVALTVPQPVGDTELEGM